MCNLQNDYHKYRINYIGLGYYTQYYKLNDNSEPPDQINHVTVHKHKIEIPACGQRFLLFQYILSHLLLHHVST